MVGPPPRAYVPTRSDYSGFARYAGADLSVLDRPLQAFERFDDFFTRPLPPGARPVEGSDVVSPVDGAVSEIGVSKSGRMIQCKGLDYTVRGLLGDGAHAAGFEGGAYATLYLAPRDYHRIHSPVDGRITGYQHIPGTFYPVNPLSVRNVAGLFSMNERLVTYLDSGVGRVAVVKVAATGVGHISLSYEPGLATPLRGAGTTVRYSAPRAIGRGEELGMFHLGSTVIVLFEPGRVVLEGAPGDVVRVGRRLGRSARRGEFAA
jgi:phosphatidylserine decarboxylase